MGNGQCLAELYTLHMQDLFFNRFQQVKKLSREVLAVGDHNGSSDYLLSY
jgi:hypothetical protein